MPAARSGHAADGVGPGTRHRQQRRPVGSAAAVRAPQRRPDGDRSSGAASLAVAGRRRQRPGPLLFHAGVGFGLGFGLGGGGGGGGVGVGGVGGVSGRGFGGRRRRRRRRRPRPLARHRVENAGTEPADDVRRQHQRAAGADAARHPVPLPTQRPLSRRHGQFRQTAAHLGLIGHPRPLLLHALLPGKVS